MNPPKTLPSHVAVIHRNVKNIRIEVRRGGEIRLIAPFLCPATQISEIYYNKLHWIENAQKKLAEKDKYIALAATFNKLLIEGEEYDFSIDLSLSYPKIDKVQKMIFFRQNLLENPSLRELWLRQLAEAAITKKVRQIASEHNLTYRKIGIRAQRKRWGSCSTNGNLSFNWRLIMTPPLILEYLVCHELAHTVHHNHSAKFWNLVKQICPEYEAAEKWLRNNEKQIMEY